MNTGAFMYESILVKLELMDSCVELRTVSRQHGRGRRFLLLMERFMNWCERGCPGSYCERDIYSFIEISLNDDIFVIHFNWLSGSDASLHGYRESVHLPMRRVMDFLHEAQPGGVLRLLYQPVQKRPTFDFTHAQRSLHDCISDKLKRRALCKALRFVGWHDTRFIMYGDGTAGFGFQTVELRSVTGGLILHKGTRKANGGAYPYLYYSVHT